MFLGFIMFQSNTAQHSSLWIRPAFESFIFFVRMWRMEILLEIHGSVTLYGTANEFSIDATLSGLLAWFI